MSARLRSLGGNIGAADAANGVDGTAALLDRLNLQNHLVMTFPRGTDLCRIDHEKTVICTESSREESHSAREVPDLFRQLPVGRCEAEFLEILDGHPLRLVVDRESELAAQVLRLDGQDGEGPVSGVVLA